MRLVFPYFERDGRTIVYDSYEREFLEFALPPADLSALPDEVPQLLASEQAIIEKTKADSNRLDVCVITTTQCNHACVYCSVDARYNPKGKQNLGSEQLDAALNFMAQRPDAPLGVSFFGGEPTLEPGAIRHITNGLKAQGRHADFFITTNGNFPEDVRDFLLENDYWLKFSIDGTKRVQFRQRPTQNNEEAWDRIIGNVKYAVEATGNVTVRMTITNLLAEDIDEALDFFEDLG